ncbi:hypothetical protein HYX11_01295 [Candidatus Woesearchaeota archaeon]|nr:hypothetical protein [Candidatus Woesearchaeota archaeon]
MNYTKLSSTTLIIVVFLFLISCSPQLAEKPAEITTEKATPSSEVSSDETPIVSNSKPTITIVPPQEEANDYPANIKPIIEKGKKLTSYKYVYDLPSGDSYEYSINGANVKKYYTTTRKSNILNVYYNEIYFNVNTKEGYAICSMGASSCKNVWEKAFPISYDLEKVAVTPSDLINSIGYDAKKIGEQTYDNYQTIIIEHTNAQGKKEELWLNSYYGLPMIQIIYDTVNGEDKEIEKHTFTRLSSPVMLSEVTLSENFEIQSEVIQ